MQLLFTSFEELETTKKIFESYGIKTLKQALEFDTILKNFKN